MNRDKFYEDGYLDVFKVEAGSYLLDLQKKIYSITKDYLIEHDSNKSLDKKLTIPFRKIPERNFWSFFMNEVNKSQELENLIESQPIYNAFKNIFDEPCRFEISAFRARLPDEKRVIYNWHQDEGTWFLSKKKLSNKLSATLWFSVNGSNYDNSIHILKKSHKNKLLNHKFVDGQGYFSADLNETINDKDIYRVKTEPSEAVLFHPLTLHRSVSEGNTINMRPRYSIDIRFFEKKGDLKYKTNTLFKIKKFIKSL